jgi:D-aminoacyl-tRNA deacylase
MRAVAQRVSGATVAVDGKTAASIGEGIVALIGIHKDDGDADIEYITKKIIGVRIFDDEGGVMNRSVADTGGEILLVSQFTLCGDARKGRRPSYSDAMPPDTATLFFAKFVDRFRNEFNRVQTGVFGAHMVLTLVNDGPVTILFDSGRAF